MYGIYTAPSFVFLREGGEKKMINIILYSVGLSVCREGLDVGLVIPPSPTWNFRSEKLAPSSLIHSPTHH